VTRQRLVLTAVLCIGSSSALAHFHPFGNPWKEQRQSKELLLRDPTMPAQTRAVLVNKCADCHSQARHAPVYAFLAPGSWLMERDVIEGRAHMNLSQWEALAPERTEVLKQEIVRQAKTGAMPPVQYRLLHWSAGLSAQDVHALGLLQTGQEGADASTHEAGDAARGKMVFEKRCTGCHAMDANREGPQLRTVYGRKAGSIAGFQYSASLKSSGLTWNPETLERWLTDPDAMVSGNDMSFATPKAADRKDLIAFLQQAASK
jgi:cytochrome c